MRWFSEKMNKTSIQTDLNRDQGKKTQRQKKEYVNNLYQ